MKTFSYLSLFLFLLTSSTLSAQTNMSGFFGAKGDLSISLGYNRATTDGFWVGDVEMDAIPAHDQFEVDIISLYGTYSILDDLQLVVSVPYISIGNTSGAADPVTGLTEESGIQDPSFGLKYRFAQIGGGEKVGLDLYVGAAASFPGGYEPNGILSIGSGATTGTGTLGGQLMTPSGVFLNANVGYSLRGEAENNGTGDDFDVPDAVLASAKLGYAGSKIYGEVFYDYQSSTDGVDIMGEGFTGNFPETEVNFGRLGAAVYVPLGNSPFGVSANYSTFVSGRNLAKLSYFGGGVTWNFSAF